VADQPATAAAAAVEGLAPTPACADDEPTPPQTAGPFYTPDTPERTVLREAGMAGTPLLLTGVVRRADCLPVGGALLDFWHSDDAGLYDNSGFRLRGHQFSDSEGRYVLDTILPGLYPGRTRHIHVRVQAPNEPVLTTQLYFPGEPSNATDGLYNPALEVNIRREPEAPERAEFDFVI
jgi:protocatechuate 3,4-dioxygenase beta subunit